MRRRVLLLLACPLVVASCSGSGSGAALGLLTTPNPTLNLTPSAAATPGATPRSAHPAPTPTATPARSTSPAATTRHTASPTPRRTAPTHTSRPSPTKTSAAYVITLQDYRFSPQNPVVPVGTTVRVVNNGPSSHTWTSGTAPVHTGPFDSGNLDPGQAYTYTFHTAGTYNFFCQYHYASGMKGRITVQ